MGKTPSPRTDRELISRVTRSAGQRAGYKQLVRELGLGGGRERRLLLEQLTRITARGELVKVEEELWALPAATPERTARVSRAELAERGAAAGLRATRDSLVAGRLDLHRDGYGFVRPNGSSSREDDLFIPPSELNGAMQGDEVLVDEAPRGRDGRPSGRVMRVLTRRNPTVVGIFHYARGRGDSRRRRESEWVGGALVKGNYVTPLDERMGAPLLIPEGAEEVVAREEPADRVLGDEVRAARAAWVPEDAFQPLEGMAVDVEITEFPQPGRPARGRVIEVLGPPDAFGVDVEIVIRKHHLPHVFPANVLAAAAASAEETVAAANPEEVARRTDFRGLPIVTIDGETARDFDDAVLVRELPNGNHELQVHIADVSHYVWPETALDLEARLRGTSVYFPDRAVPMLPPALSSGMCSLRPDEDRFVLSCVMEVDGRGEIVGYEVGEGIIRSARRMTYTQVQGILDDTTDADKETRLEFSELVPEFERMYALALKLNAKRKRRGSIDFDLPEPVVQFDPQGDMKAIVRSERGWSHRLIEEFMLSANECVATWIESQEVPGVYRIHEMPDPKRIVDFEETAAGFGYTLGIGNLPVKKLTMKSDRRDVKRGFSGGGRAQGATVHEVADRIPVTPQMYQRLTAKIAGTPEERILAYLMLRSLKQARYAEKNEGHFALASPSYTHFTSPIRRYPDLIVHRLLRALLEEGADPQGGPILSSDVQPWQRELDAKEGRRHAAESAKKKVEDDAGPMPRAELEAIAVESSQAERRADDAERELIEWKKLKFMQDRVGEEFDAIVLSCTKYGFFVELEELFIEGLVPIATLGGFGAKDYRDDDRYVFRDTDRAIVGQRSGRVFRMGMKVRVLLDRIDRQQRRLQFALLEVKAGQQAEVAPAAGSLRRRKVRGSGDEAGGSPDRSGKARKGKAKKRVRNGKAKVKRRG
jgi:ribonuclease R